MYANLERIYKYMRLAHYKTIFESVREKAGSLTATEAASADVIYLLDEPTLGEFAEFLNISQPNASYKINALVSKGYVTKNESDDRRAYRLCVTEKFFGYYGRRLPMLDELVRRATSGFTAAERALFDRMVAAVADCCGSS